MWVHPEQGLKLRRRGESDWRKLADFSELLSVAQRGSRVTIQFTTLNHMEVELDSESHAVDLLLYLEGLNCLLVAAHHFFDAKMCSPTVLEQSTVNAFGPISRATAENYLSAGQCLIRRSPEAEKSRSFYLTSKNQDSFQLYDVISVIHFYDVRMTIKPIKVWKSEQLLDQVR